MEREFRFLQPGKRTGVISAPASKSYAHRMIICAALGEKPVELECGSISEDIAATAGCISSLCADVTKQANGILRIEPEKTLSSGQKILPCGESGTTLRFLLPICGAFGKNARFQMKGRLADRPISELTALLSEHGMIFERKDNELICKGELKSGIFQIAGNISSQYISALLMALPLLNGSSCIMISGKIESSPYILMTEFCLKKSGIQFERKDNVYYIPGNQRYSQQKRCRVEGDWSNGSVFLCMGAFSEKGITVKNLPTRSIQGDKKILEILRQFGTDVTETENSVTVRGSTLKGCTIDASDIPDLIPPIAVIASAAEGTTEIINAGRLRLKESDRLESTAALLKCLGGNLTETDEGLIIKGIEKLNGGVVDTFSDHRIAMAAAVSACRSEKAVNVQNSDCVRKSFPEFWNIFNELEIES